MMGIDSETGHADAKIVWSISEVAGHVEVERVAHDYHAPCLAIDCRWAQLDGSQVVSILASGFFSERPVLIAIEEQFFERISRPRIHAASHQPFTEDLACTSMTKRHPNRNHEPRAFLLGNTLLDTRDPHRIYVVLN
jgi:hypothetical protein